MSRKWTLNNFRSFLLISEYLINSHLGALYLYLSVTSKNPAGWQLIYSSICFSWEWPSGVHKSNELFHAVGILCLIFFFLQFLVHFIVSSPVLQSTIHPLLPFIFFFLWTGNKCFTQSCGYRFCLFRRSGYPRVKSWGFPELFNILQFVFLVEMQHVCHNSQKRLSVKRLVLIFQLMNHFSNT